MKSPITGKEMPLKREKRLLSFRKEEFAVLYHYYICDDTGEKFTSTELDELNLIQLYNQYRSKHNLPFPDDIKAVREKYSLPANKMSEILGFGVNSYRNYENGEVPNHANGRLILMANDPKQFMQLVQMTETLDDHAKEKLLKKINHIIEDERQHFLYDHVEGYLLDGKHPDIYTGYRRPSFQRLTEMVVFFAEKMKPWKTQLNKLLFYADFLHFKKTAFSISGARYRVINMGPVPNNYNGIFEFIANNDDVDIWATEFDHGIGEQFKPNKNRKFNPEIFSESELEVLNLVAREFKDLNTDQVINLSHKENAWLLNQADKEIISYGFAFDLKCL